MKMTRIYVYALLLLALIPLTTGLTIYQNDGVIYWKLDDTSLATVIDSQGNINGGIQHAINGSDAILNRSYRFNGTSDGIFGNNIPASFNLGSKSFSYSTWFKSNQSLSETGTITCLESAGSNSQRYCTRITQTGQLSFAGVIVLNNEFMTASSNLNDTQWHHMALVSNSTNITLYLDGQKVNITSQIGGTFVGDDYDLGLRRRVLQENFFNGSIDETSLWNRSLSDGEIKLLYNGGQALEFSLADVLFLNQSFEENAIELSVQDFTANLTLDSSDWQSVTARLNYNNTFYSASTSDSGDYRLYTSSFNIGSFNDNVNITFYWEIELINQSGTHYVNSSMNNQSVINLGVDDCSTNTVVLMNITLVDEDDQTAFSNGAGDNVSISIDLSLNDGITFNQTFNETNPVDICITDELSDLNLLMDATIQYSAFDHVTEFYNFQNFLISADTIPQNITLYDLHILTSQEFLITYKNSAFLPVADALIDITRKYVGEDVFKSVERPATDSFGQAIGHFVLSDQIYTIIVSKDGVILSTFEDVYAVCQDLSSGQCEINLNEIDTGTQPEDFTTREGVSYSMSFDSSTNIVSAIFSIVDGSSQTINLNVSTLQDSFVCSNGLTSSAGTVSCTVPDTFQNTTVVATLTKEGSTLFLSQAYYFISDFDAGDIFGGSGVILALIMLITLPLIAITDRIMMVVFAMIGMIMAIVMGVISGGSIIGAGSTVMWFIIAGAIIIWKIGRVSK